MSTLKLLIILVFIAVISGCAPGPKPKPVTDPPNIKEEDITDKPALPKIEEPQPSDSSTQSPAVTEPTRPPVTDPNRPPKRTLIWPQQKGSDKGGSIR